MLMYRHRLPSPDPSLVSNAASTKSLAFWRIADRMVPVSPIETTGSLPRIDIRFRVHRLKSDGAAAAELENLQDFISTLVQATGNMKIYLPGLEQSGRGRHSGVGAAVGGG